MFQRSLQSAMCLRGMQCWNSALLHSAHLWEVGWLQTLQNGSAPPCVFSASCRWRRESSKQKEWVQCCALYRLSGANCKWEGKVLNTKLYNFETFLKTRLLTNVETARLFSYCLSVIGYQLATAPATAPECGCVINLHVNVQRWQKYSKSALD